MKSNILSQLNPAQGEVHSWSAAIDSSYKEKKLAEDAELAHNILFPLGIPSYKNRDWTSDWFLAKSITKDSFEAEEFPDTTVQREEASTNIIHFRPSVQIENRFIELQKWECCVTEIGDDSIFASLVDLANGNPDEEAEFSKDEIDEEDLPLVRRGAIFYWNIGYLENKGQRIRASLIRFRRLPTWEKEEIEEAEKDAERLRGLLNGE